jgi:hypothetical protein
MVCVEFKYVFLVNKLLIYKHIELRNNHFITVISQITPRERRTVTSLDVVLRILENPSWNKRARKVKTLKELRQIIFDFCKDNGIVVKTDEETLCT